MDVRATRSTLSPSRFHSRLTSSKTSGPGALGHSGPRRQVHIRLPRRAILPAEVIARSRAVDDFDVFIEPYTSPVNTRSEPGGVGDWFGEAPRQPPLIEPGVRFSRTRLSDGVHVRAVAEEK